MGSAGIDSDEDVRLVVLPPPYMVESLASGHVDGFCVGAPWNAVAVEAGVGRILHFGCEITARMSEKVLAVRKHWAADNPATLAALIRALARAAEFIDDADNRTVVADLVARRLDVEADLVARTLAGALKVAPDGATRADRGYILIGGNGANRPDPVQAAWIYGQIVRWGQAPLSAELCAAAQEVFGPDLHDAALGVVPEPRPDQPRDRIGAFVGPDFDAANIAGYLSAWRSKRPERPRLSLVR
jgi:NitT/TauT family transport system ATP-binding protein